VWELAWRRTMSGFIPPFRRTLFNLLHINPFRMFTNRVSSYVASRDLEIRTLLRKACARQQWYSRDHCSDPGRSLGSACDLMERESACGEGPEMQAKKRCQHEWPWHCVTIQHELKSWSKSADLSVMTSNLISSKGSHGKIFDHNGLD
jgi:hypothetical protein